MSAPEPFRTLLASWNAAIRSPAGKQIVSAWIRQDELAQQLMNELVAPPRRDTCGNG